MCKLQYKHGLLYTSIKLRFGERSVIIRDAIVDTGASHTIIATDCPGFRRWGKNGLRQIS